MLKDNTRLCDVCGEIIPKGKKYAVNLVPKENAHVLRFMTLTDPELTPTTTIDSEGNLHLDICLKCRVSMDIQGGTEQVN